MGIPVNMQTLMRAERCALGIVDPRVELECRGLAGFGNFDRTVGADIPWVGKIQVQRRTRHQLGVGEPRSRIFRRESGDTAGLGHRRPDRIRREIRRAGRTLALPK